MASAAKSVWCIGFALALAGCQLATASAPNPLPETGDTLGRLEGLTALDQRVARVAWRLSKANVELCPVVRNSAGWALHSANQYSLQMRPHALRRFSLRGDLPGVLSVPGESPASQAGLRSGDLIVAVNKQVLAVGNLDRPPQFGGLEANLQRLDAALAKGPVELTVERDQKIRSVSLEPLLTCGYDVQLYPSDDLNAQADGRRLFISTALAQFAQTDDELALILGHELAHNVLGHRRWNETGGEGRTIVERDCDPRLCDTGSHEQQADRVGLFLMARAGYEPGVAAPFWRRFGASNWRVRYPQLAHASAGTRARRLEGVQLEIQRLVASDRPLTP